MAGTNDNDFAHLLSPEEVTHVAALRGEPSIGRSRAVSCEQRDSATGSAYIRWSWSAGLPRNAVSCLAGVAANEAVCPLGEARRPASAA
jgi:hypothetical protein